MRVGRTEPAIIRRSVPAEIPANAETTIVKVARGRGNNDPFESYSILKPEEPPWLLPLEKRGPNAIAGLVIVLLIAGFGTFYGYRHWIDSADQNVHDAKTAQQTTGTLGQSRIDKPRYNVPVSKPQPW